MKKLLSLIIVLLAGSMVAKAQSTVEPPDGLPEAAAYSIYYENYKNEQYDSAIRYGRWIWKGMPQTIKGYSRFDLETNLSRLITAYAEASKEKEDPSLRFAYLDTARIIFEKVFTELGEEKIDAYSWYLDQGRFFQQNSDFIEGAMTKAAESYRKAFDLKPEEMTKMADGYYVEVMIRNMVSNRQKDMALKYIEKATPYAGTDLKDYFDSVRNQLFDSPQERITFLEGELEKNPQDTEIMTELRDLYEEQEMMDKAQQLNQKLYELDPSFETTRALADFAIRNANYDAAIRYLKEAMGKTDDAEKKARIALDLSDAYKNNGNLQEARRYARQAANFDKNWGQPYIQIASIYAQAINDCTSGRKMEREDRTIYWLVLDYLDKARNVDPSVASTVQRQYQSYKPVTPTTEDKFFKGWKTGEKMKIDGSINSCYSWINETTAVR